MKLSFRDGDYLPRKFNKSLAWRTLLPEQCDFFSKR